MTPWVLISRLQTYFGKCENSQLWGQGTMQMNCVYLLCTLVSTSIQWREVTSPSESCLQRPNELSHWIIYHGTWHTLSTVPASWCHMHYYYLASVPALSIQCTLCLLPLHCSSPTTRGQGEDRARHHFTMFQGIRASHRAAAWTGDAGIRCHKFTLTHMLTAICLWCILSQFNCLKTPSFKT